MFLKFGNKIDFSVNHERRKIITSASVMIIDHKDKTLTELIALRRKTAQDLVRRPDDKDLNDLFDFYQEEIKKFLAVC